MNTAICAAIANRAIVQFTYDGGTRTVEPHAHGTSTAGNEVLRGFQTDGVSRSGEPVGWKLYTAAKMSAFRQTGQTFSSNRLGYNPNDEAMAVVHCHV